MQSSVYAATATNDGRKQLSSAGLPASLETYKSGGEIPETLWGSILRVQSLGGMNELNEKCQDLESSAMRAMLSIDNINASILREERIDQSFRVRFPSSLKGTPSTQLNVDIKVRINKYRQTDILTDRCLDRQIDRLTRQPNKHTLTHVFNIVWI